VTIPPRHRRLLAAFALAAACAGLLAAWATASTRTHERASTAVFRNGLVSFRYPASWSATISKQRGLHVEPMVYLTTARGRPAGRLAPNGVLVTWENRTFPGVIHFPGASTRVGDHAARLAVERPGACGGLGADETISVAIAGQAPGSWTQVDACLRGPRLAALERQLRALLASARFAGRQSQS
jgi:hypothetical protein